MLKPAFAVAVLAVLASSSASFATESALGRYIPGIFAMPKAGVVPPVPGFYYQSQTMYYTASVSRDVAVPIGGVLEAGLSADFISETLTGLWVPGISPAANTTLAFSLSVPIQYMGVDVTLGPRGRSDNDKGIGDIMFAPTLGWHGGANFFSASLRIFAPTGSYDPDRLANIGLNYWTFSPTFSYTRLDIEHGLDFSVTGSIDFNTKNTDTDYQSGAMAHLDASLVKTFSNRFGIGIFGSVLYQIADDKGDLAESLNGFRGRSFAVGPMLTYTAGTEENPISFSLSYSPEFHVKNRLEGDGVFLNISGSF